MSNHGLYHETLYFSDWLCCWFSLQA